MHGNANGESTLAARHVFLGEKPSLQTCMAQPDKSHITHCSVHSFLKLLWQLNNIFNDGK